MWALCFQAWLRQAVESGGGADTTDYRNKVLNAPVLRQATKKVFY